MNLPILDPSHGEAQIVILYLTCFPQFNVFEFHLFYCVYQDIFLVQGWTIFHYRYPPRTAYLLTVDGHWRCFHFHSRLFITRCESHVTVCCRLFTESKFLSPATSKGQGWKGEKSFVDTWDAKKEQVTNFSNYTPFFTTVWSLSLSLILMMVFIKFQVFNSF